MGLFPKGNNSKVTVAIVVAAALAFSFMALAIPLSSFAADGGNSTSTDRSMVNSTNTMSTNSTSNSVGTNVTVSPSVTAATTAGPAGKAQVWHGRIANLQMNGTQVAWIQSGAWMLKAPAGAAIDDNANLKFVAKIDMVKPDGTAMHKHSISNLKVSNATSNSSGLSVEGTATVTMKDGPVQDVPIKMNIVNKAVIAIWIGPDKVDKHFGTDPMYGTLFQPRAQSQTGTSATGSSATSGSTSSNSTSSSSSSNSTSTTSSSSATNSTSSNSSTSNNNSTSSGNSTGSNSTSSSGTSSNPSGSNSTSSSTTPASTSTTGNTIQMKAGDSVNLYSWFVGGQENPTIKLAANSPATITIQNPTETKHELVIEFNGKEVASSGDIAPGGSGQLTYTPTAAGTLQYHCEYHQDTMKGTIQVQ